MPRYYFVSLAVLLLFTTLAIASAEADCQTPARTRISGPDLPVEQYLSFADEDAFARRLSPPPKLDRPPAPGGAAYSIVSPYWDKAIREDDGEPGVEETATYYPQGAHVRARQAGNDVWVVLDLRQRAILDRYIRLAREQNISAVPDALEVVIATARTEPVSVEVGGRVLNDVQTAGFWQAAAGIKASASVPRTSDLEAFEKDKDSVWLVFGLPEGRSIQMRYLIGRSALLMETGHLEFYGLSSGWLDPVLGPGAPGPSTPQIDQEQRQGSALWWPVMIGGGLALITAALWLGRRPATAP